MESKVLVFFDHGITRILNKVLTDGEDQENDSDDSDGSFHYPTSPTSTARPPSIRSHTMDSSSGPSTSRNVTDLTPQLSQAPEFRVPTHESPQKVLTPRMVPTPHSMHVQWERDDSVTECRSCNRRFTFLFRKAFYHVLCVTDSLLTTFPYSMCVSVFIQFRLS